jgi:hypothetical protein
MLMSMSTNSDIEAERDDNRDKFKQGKEPMPPELLQGLFLTHDMGHG